ncbi:MAG: recombinase family protein [Peptococcaceae bacterium MAG4]|nr:recombinase family protein [Peptococcaceae bacterium MAG4]
MQPRAFSYIRFSSPEQEKGDSLRRQIQLSEEYCKQHGLILDDTLKLTDRGLSAFKGIHRTKGALGEFLRLVEEGKIPPGSVLLVENLDRLSREQILDALNQFTSIIKAGIKIVTLQDGMEYDQESINQNWAQLIISITYMARAHDESETKSKRISAVWENKRSKAGNGGKKLTAKAPAWLKLSQDRTKFILIPEAAKAIELIFRKKLAGKGAERIARELNDDPNIWKPPRTGPKKTGGWRGSYINKILRNRAVIGEFQPYKLVDGKRQPIGDPIPDYFPPVIDKELFYQVQAQLQANAEKKGNAGGRTGKVSNLFTHVIKCGLCGYPMHFINKGEPPKGGKYLVCDASRRLKTCTAKPIRYEEFEQLFFDNFEELDISQLIPGEDETQARINELEKLLTVNRQRLLEIDSKVENFSDTIGRTKDSRIREQLEKKLSQAFDDKERLESENKKFEREITELRQQKAGLEKDIEQAKEIYQLLNSAQGEAERIELRLRLRQQIQKSIEWIKIYPLQEPYQEIQETEEPGIVKIMKSKYIDKVRIKFRGSRDLRVLYLKNHAELSE